MRLPMVVLAILLTAPAGASAPVPSPPSSTTRDLPVGAADLAVEGIQGPEELAFCQSLYQSGVLWVSPLPGWTPLQVAQQCRTLLLHECRASVGSSRYGVGPFAGLPLRVANQQCAQLSYNLAGWIRLNHQANPYFGSAVGSQRPAL